LPNKTLRSFREKNKQKALESFTSPHPNNSLPDLLKTKVKNKSEKTRKKSYLEKDL
jgi:hypothetical protein